MEMEDRNRRTQVSADLEHLMLREETSWRQKSRALWLKEGDKNSKFFHAMANSHRSSNSILSLDIDGVQSTCPDAIRNHIVDFYQSLFNVEGRYHPRMDGVAFDSISESDAVWLERPFGEDEVHIAVQSCEGDKAPGPDGYPMAFFQRCWEVVGGDVGCLC